jgi:hypothetical protein
MNKLLIASAFASISLFSGSAEAACRQVYGGTSCNWMGQCWHNPPKTVCDAPRIAAPPPQNRVSIQPNAGNRFISDQGGGLISNNRGGLISNNNRLIGNDAASMRR